MNFSTFNIADIIFKSLKGDLNSDEKKILDRWLNFSETNQNCYKRISQKANFVNRKQLYEELESFKNYSYIKQHIQKRTKLLYLRYFTASIAAVLLCCIGWFFLENRNTPPTPNPIFVSQKITPGKSVAILETAEGKTINLGASPSKIIQNQKAVATSKGNTLSYTKQTFPKRNPKNETYNTLKIPRGGEYKLQLSDGTKIWLNSETTIKYPVQFLKKQRVVYVSGEAFFDVTPDKKRPFIVESNKTSIKVLGTTFNLRAYENEKYLQTTLVSGKVNVIREGETSVLLPSQQYSCNKNTSISEVKYVDVSLYTSWKDGLFVFKSQKLSYILNEIARWYNVDFVYKDEIVKNYVFSGRLKKYENANALLRVFEETGNVKFKKEGQQIYVTKNKSN